jgi:hypothetical protein
MTITLGTAMTTTQTPQDAGFGGTITEKLIDEAGDHVVKVQTWASNQRGQQVMPGSATVALPTRGAQP